MLAMLLVWVRVLISFVREGETLKKGQEVQLPERDAVALAEMQPPHVEFLQAQLTDDDGEANERTQRDGEALELETGPALPPESISLRGATAPGETSEPLPNVDGALSAAETPATLPADAALPPTETSVVPAVTVAQDVAQTSQETAASTQEAAVTSQDATPTPPVDVPPMEAPAPVTAPAAAPKVATQNVRRPAPRQRR